MLCRRNILLPSIIMRIPLLDNKAIPAFFPN